MAMSPMDTQIEIVFRNMRPSFRVRDRIEDYVDKLDRFDQRIERCQVVVQSPRQHLDRTLPHHVTIRAALPSGEIVIKERRPRASALFAVKKAFESLTHRLEASARARQEGRIPDATVKTVADSRSNRRALHGPPET
jgi:ribosome-associated translation inhibitor RaiA